MPDEYWLILRGPRFKHLSWPKKTTFMNKYCEFIEVTNFVANAKKDHPDWKINIGVTRGNDIYIIA